MLDASDFMTEVALLNNLSNIPAVLERVEIFCNEHEIKPDVIFAVSLTLEELLSNTINYGYNDDRIHRIEVIVRLEGDTLVLIIVDDALPFDPTELTETTSQHSLQDQEIGGLGLQLVNQMMDSVIHRRHAECNVVTLTKSIG